MSAGGETYGDLRSTRVISAWSEADHARAFLRSDHDVIDATRSVRALVVEELLRAPNSRDLLHAFGTLGRLMAERGGSPTLAATTIDGLVGAIERAPADGWTSARAAIAESYVRACTDASRDGDARRWEYPACAIPLHDGIIAIAAGYRDDDEDALTAWASRVAHAASLAGVRRAVLSGAPKAVAALEESLGVAGIERIASYAGSGVRKK